MAAQGVFDEAIRTAWYFLRAVRAAFEWLDPITQFGVAFGTIWIAVITLMLSKREAARVERLDAETQIQQYWIPMRNTLVEALRINPEIVGPGAWAALFQSVSQKISDLNLQMAAAARTSREAVNAIVAAEMAMKGVKPRLEELDSQAAGLGRDVGWSIFDKVVTLGVSFRLEIVVIGERGQEYRHGEHHILDAILRHYRFEEWFHALTPREQIASIHVECGGQTKNGAAAVAEALDAWREQLRKHKFDDVPVHFQETLKQVRVAAEQVGAVLVRHLRND
jgi:hypothetical protein